MNCPRCNAASNLLFEVRDTNRRVSDVCFPYYRCTACELIFLRPVPPDLDRYYAADYYGIPDSLAALQKQAEPQRYKIDLIKRFAPTGRLLEIGASFGSFAYLAKTAGYTVDTIEMDARCCDFLRNVVGINAIQHHDPAAALSSLGAYDVIALFQVIEHLPNPWQTIAAMLEHLAPGGIIVIAAPNPGALQLKLFGRHWTHIDAPRHLQLIPAKTIEQDMRDLKLIFKTTADREGLSWNAFGWRMSLANLTTQPLLKLILFTLGRALTKPMRRIEQVGMRGSTYTVIFQKDQA